MGVLKNFLEKNDFKKPIEVIAEQVRKIFTLSCITSNC